MRDYIKIIYYVSLKAIARIDNKPVSLEFF